MDKSDIQELTSYISIHDVPYRVIRIDGQKVTARCESGKNNNAEFEISLGRFATSMKRRALG